MKILLDTNILLSAALFPNGVAAQAYFKAVTYPYSSIVCEYSIDELRRVFNRKFPTRLGALDRFLEISSTSFSIIPTPSESVSDEVKIRDVKDRPLIRAAQITNANLFRCKFVLNKKPPRIYELYHMILRGSGQRKIEFGYVFFEILLFFQKKTTGSL